MTLNALVRKVYKMCVNTLSLMRVFLKQYINFLTHARWMIPLMVLGFTLLYMMGHLLCDFIPSLYYIQTCKVLFKAPDGVRI